MRPQPPSWTRGGRAAVELGRVTAAVWAVELVAAVATLAVADEVLVDGLVGLAGLPPGDWLLEGADAARRAASAAVVGATVLATLLAAWGILWRGGVARWAVWRPGPTLRVGEVLGLGLTGWWRYARLWATVVAIAAAAALAGLRCLVALVAAASDGGSGPALWLSTAGALAAVALVVATRLAWLAACWELARPDRRSATAALGRGLLVLARRPVASATALLVWGGVAAAASAAPLVLGGWLPTVRGPAAMAVMVIVLGAARAFARVALLASFGPAGWWREA